VIARNPERNRDAVLGRLCHKRLEALRVFAAEHELAARKIERRQEMVEKSGAYHAVDSLHPKSFGELAKGQRHDGQVLNGPVAELEFSMRDCPTLACSPPANVP
jgi:hypothetical protein